MTTRPCTLPDERREIYQLVDGDDLLECHCDLFDVMGLEGYRDWLEKRDKFTDPTWCNIVKENGVAWLPTD